MRPGDPESMREWAELLVARAREEGVALTGEGGLLTGLMRQVLQTGLGDPKYRPCPLLRKYVAAGWLGRKSGRGFHEYR